MVRGVLHILSQIQITALFIECTIVAFPHEAMTPVLSNMK